MKTDLSPSVFSGTSLSAFALGDLRVRVEVVIERADANVARGQDQVGFVGGAHHIHGAQFMGLQLQRVDVHHDLAVAAAVGRRHGGARNARDLISNLELQVIVELRFGQALAVDGEQANRKARRVHAHHDRRKRALRKPPQVRHREIGNLRYIGVGVRARLKIDLDQADAGHRARFHVIDSAAQGEETLERVRDIGFDLLRRHAAVKGGHFDHGNIDRRKHVHRHLHEGGEPKNADEKAYHDDEIRMSQSKMTT